MNGRLVMEFINPFVNIGVRFPISLLLFFSIKKKKKKKVVCEVDFYLNLRVLKENVRTR